MKLQNIVGDFGCLCDICETTTSKSDLNDCYCKSCRNYDCKKYDGCYKIKKDAGFSDTIREMKKIIRK